MKIINAVWTYLKDWKNLLTHSLIGVAILMVAFYMPVAPVFRVFILIVVIGFNVVRMKHAKKYLPAKE
jgi:hypothetical protein